MKMMEVKRKDEENKKTKPKYEGKIGGKVQENGKMNLLQFDYTYQEEHVVVDRDNSSFIL